MGLGERFSFALERDDLDVRRWNRFGRNDRLEIVFRDEAGRQRLAVQHDVASGEIRMILRIDS